MDWLKVILEKARKQQILDVEATMISIRAEFPKHAVPKNNYNEVSRKLKEAKNTIEDLKHTKADNDALHKTVKAYETVTQDLKTQILNITKCYELKSQLKEKGVVDPDYLLYKVGGISRFTFDENGKPVGVGEMISDCKKKMPYLFQ